MGIANDTSTSEILAEVPKALRALMQENIKLASQVEAFEKRAQAEDLVSEMDRKGLNDPGQPFQEKVAALLDSNKDLEVLKEAVKMASPDFSFASVSEDEHDNSPNAFEEFILGAG